MSGFNIPAENWSDDDETALAMCMVHIGDIVFDLSHFWFECIPFGPSLMELNVQNRGI
jgi:hypothetical protein